MVQPLDGLTTWSINGRSASLAPGYTVYLRKGEFGQDKDDRDYERKGWGNDTILGRKARRIYSDKVKHDQLVYTPAGNGGNSITVE